MLSKFTEHLLNIKFPDHHEHKKTEIVATDLTVRVACACGETLRLSLADAQSISANDDF